MTTDLLECLEDWGKHFIETRNPAGLAVLRAKTTIKNQSDRIGELLEAVERGNECREMLKRCELWLSTAPEGRKMQLECQRVLSLHNDLAEARRNGAPLPEKASPPLPASTC